MVMTPEEEAAWEADRISLPRKGLDAIDDVDRLNALLERILDVSNLGRIAGRC